MFFSHLEIIDICLWFQFVDPLSDFMIIYMLVTVAYIIDTVRLIKEPFISRQQSVQSLGPFRSQFDFAILDMITVFKQCYVQFLDFSFETYDCRMCVIESIYVCLQI